MVSGTFTVPGGCPSATMTSFELNFYNNAFPLINIATYTLGAIPAITDVYIDALLNLAGVNFGIGVIDVAGGPFTLGARTFEEIDLDFTISPFLGPVVTLYDYDTESAFSSATTGPNAPTSTWTLVPEPTTLVLVAGALAALGLRRRKA